MCMLVVDYLLCVVLVIQTSHWHTIFAGFNEQYDPHQGYTLEYFLDRDLEKFSDLISEVHGFASQQSRLREKVIILQKIYTLLG